MHNHQWFVWRTMSQASTNTSTRLKSDDDKATDSGFVSTVLA
jgi:hypothetical protein